MNLGHRLQLGGLLLSGSGLRAKARILDRMGDGSLMITPIIRSRYFGKFLSKREAEKWTEQHNWLTDKLRSGKENLGVVYLLMMERISPR
jgi:hypothetical protein